MTLSVRDKGGPLLGFACCALMFLAGCSMQMSGSKWEASRSQKQQEAAARSAYQDEPVVKNTIRVDYLRQISEVKSPELYVYKERRRLYVVDSNVLIRDYPVGLGRQPRGDKEKSGDGRTPEGRFTVCTKSDGGPSQRVLGLSYPSKKHAERAFFSGLITPGEFKNILTASERRIQPPSDTNLGGKVFIQSGGAHSDWTDGGIALYNSDMEELMQIAKMGTPITIRP
jgi:hypothetical protein